jgi:DNA-binding CsgD family transcriptional regulator
LWFNFSLCWPCSSAARNHRRLAARLPTTSSFHRADDDDHVYDGIDVRELGADFQHVPLFLAEEAAYTTARDRVFVHIGYRRRATGIALRLARLTGKERYLAYAGDALREASPDYWMSRALRAMREGTGPAVTDAEMVVLRLLVQGKTYKEIAAARQTSAKTVGHHIQSLYRKFGVNSRGELTASALRHGIVRLERNGAPPPS